MKYLEDDAWNEVVGTGWYFIFKDAKLKWDSIESEELILTRCRDLNSSIGETRTLMEMLWGVEFVADRKTKDPFSPEAQFNRRVGDLAFERGVIFYPGSGCVDGVRGDHLLIAPPFVIVETEIDEMVGLLREVVIEVWEKFR